MKDGHCKTVFKTTFQRWFLLKPSLKLDPHRRFYKETIVSGSLLSRGSKHSRTPFLSSLLLVSVLLLEYFSFSAFHSFKSIPLPPYTSTQIPPLPLSSLHVTPSCPLHAPHPLFESDPPLHGERAMLDHTLVALGESAKERESDGVVHGDLMSSSRSGNKGLVRSEAMDTVPSSR